MKEVGPNQAVGEPVQIAQFWRASPTAIWNGVLEQVLAGRNPGLAEKARAFALLYLAAADSSIAFMEFPFVVWLCPSTSLRVRQDPVA